LDGETNLKQRQALKETSGLVNNLTSLGSYHAKVNTESPSGDLYHFEGSLTDKLGQYPLTVNQLLQRGSTLRNTAEIFGLVVYTGEESKIRMNSNQAAKTKVPTLEKQTNRVILAIFGFLLIFCGICTYLYIRWDTVENAKLRHWYLFEGKNEYAFVFFTFLILFNAFIPISLYVTMEVVKVVQVFMMNSDLDMYDAERDIPMEAKTSSLNEELGQVQYIFSDKTGTLTENVMEFRMFSCAGRSIRHFSVPEASAPDSFAAEDVISQIAEVRAKGRKLSPDLQQTFDFLEALALCHDAVPELGSSNNKNNDNKKESLASINYQASSADEVALLNAARDMYFTFTSRTPTTISVNILNSEEDTKFEILHTIEFTSSRKRMSTIYRYPNGRIVLICKGADSVIMERLKDASTLSDTQRAINEKTFEHTEAYAIVGLRTLLYGYRILDESEYEEWADRYAEATTSLENRGKKIEEVAEWIEKDLALLGATAIEDKLQEGVPETIEKLRRANIRLWMLTGDKTETAINIGRTCSIIKKDSVVGVIKYDSNVATKLPEQLVGIQESVKSITRDLVEAKTRDKDQHFVVVMEGDILTKMEKDLAKHLSDDSKDSGKKKSNEGSSSINKLRKRKDNPDDEPIIDAFLDLAIAADNVICCRFSPSQKALIVSQMKTRLSDQHGASGASPVLTKLQGGPLTGWERFMNTIKFKPRPSGVTLAIGDGANDIPMIESAHVGIGITGREGLAAARASDYSIAKFRFLLPLLLVHGRWAYVRISVFTLGTFYKVSGICFLLFIGVCVRRS
jgi:phospholipid-translocating P-type ATPase (flippase)